MRLTEHFVSSEFACHDGSVAPARYLRWARVLCERYLEPLRSEFGPVTIISGFRTATHNADVGGAPKSYHRSLKGRRGAAADLQCDRGTPEQWYAFLDELGVPGLGLAGQSVHADNRAGHARW